jgi:hypothetical protein
MRATVIVWPARLCASETVPDARIVGCKLLLRLDSNQQPSGLTG